MNSNTKICVLLILISMNLPLMAETKDIMVQGRAAISGNLTLDQAKHQAINMARSLAIEQAAGVVVNSTTLLQNSLIVSEFINTFSYGFLIEEEILGWKGDWAKAKDPNQLGIPVIEVTLRGVISLPEKSFYHNYVLKANLNKKSYISGEEVKLDVSATEDLYIIVVNYTADNKIIPIFPNAASKQNTLLRENTLTLPGQFSNEFDLTVTTLPGHNNNTEAFVVFGFQMDGGTKSIPWTEIFPAGTDIKYSQFFNKIFQLPITWMAQKTLIYTVVSN